MTDRIGPRVPASIGVLVTLAAFTVGLLLKADSSWLWPAVLLGLTGLGAGFFNAPNQTAIIGSVPRHYRGFATGMVQTLFGIGSLLGISLAGVLLTVLFRYHSGNPDAQPGAGDPPAFVSSMNAVYVVCVALMASRPAGVAHARARQGRCLRSEGLKRTQERLTAWRT